MAGEAAKSAAAAAGIAHVGDAATATARDMVILAAIQRDVADASADLMMHTQILSEGFAGLNGRIDSVIAHLGALALANRAAADSAGNAGAAFRIWGTGIRLTGTALHWLVAGTMELLAVLIPATVAAGAWAAVWMQGATNVVEHMNAVYTATEAMANAGAKTAGQMVGLGRALQDAQNKANPDVYQALGAAINLVKESSGGLAQTGLQVGRIFDTFMAKVVYDFSAAGGAGK